MNARKRLTAALAGAAAALVCLSAIELQAQDPKTKKPAAGAAAAAPAAAYWQHVRYDEPELKELGKGSVEAGMNRLGEAGCTLFIVTCQTETGTPGFHYFKRAPWNKPTPRPQYEFNASTRAALSNSARASSPPACRPSNARAGNWSPSPRTKTAPSASTTSCGPNKQRRRPREQTHRRHRMFWGMLIVAAW